MANNTKSGKTTAAKSTAKKPTAKSTAKPTQSSGFQQTFRKYDSMNTGEQAAFRQGAATVSNKVKENLGLKKPRD